MLVAQKMLVNAYHFSFKMQLSWDRIPLPNGETISRLGNAHLIAPHFNVNWMVVKQHINKPDFEIDACKCFIEHLWRSTWETDAFVKRMIRIALRDNYCVTAGRVLPDVPLIFHCMASKDGRQVWMLRECMLLALYVMHAENQWPVTGLVFVHLRSMLQNNEIPQPWWKRLK
jgi:hypothetical protein